MIVAILLTAALLTLLAAAALVARSTVARTYPEALVVSALSLLVVTQLLSEALSAVIALTGGWIVVSWAAVVTALLLVAFQRRSRLPRPDTDLDRGERIGYGAVVLLGVLTFATGALVSPNNWDSLTYHLSRAGHWLQNGTLDFFPPTGSRENTMSPLADLVFAQLMAADGTASVAFLGQWASGVVVLVGVGLLARQVFHDRRVVLLSVVAGATVPMLLSQMSTTQADLVVGIPVAAAIVAWRWLDDGRTGPAVILLAAAMAVGVAVKATAALLVVPWALVMVVILIRRRSWTGLGALLGAGVAAGVLLNAGHAWRLMTQRTEDLDTATDVLNRVVTLESIGVNLIRDAATAVVVPIPALIGAIERATESLAGLLGWDIALPEATFGSGYALSVAWSEDHAAAPWHVLLALIAVVVLLLDYRRNPRPRAVVLVGVLAAQVLLIAVAIRWQPWINRFTFLIVVFAAPLIGWLLSRWPRGARAIVSVLLVVAAVAWVLVQPIRGLVGTSWLPTGVPLASAVPRYDSPLAYDRFAQMFMHHPPTARTFQAALAYADSLDPDRLVLQIGGDWWEFPVWHWYADAGERPVLSHAAEAPSEGRTVVICTTPCATAGLIEGRTFPTDGPASATVEVGPELTAGLVRQSAAP